MDWKVKNSETVLDTPFVSVTKHEALLPDGNVIPDFYTVTIPDAALIVAITKDQRILLKREYRIACQSDVIECPAGMVEKGEQPLETAKRELLEETGFVSDHWIYLGPTWESTSKLTNRMHLFLAKGAVKTGSQHLDANEHLSVLAVSLEEAVDMVMNGTIHANSTVHLILRAAKLLEKEQDK